MKIFDYIPEAQIGAINASNLFRCCLIMPNIFITEGTQDVLGNINVISSVPIYEIESPEGMTEEQQTWLTANGGNGGYTLPDYIIAKYQNVTQI